MEFGWQPKKNRGIFGELYMIKRYKHNNLKLFILFYLFLFSTTLVFGQTEDEFYVDKSFVITHSSKNYASAEKAAKNAREKLGWDLALRDCAIDSLKGFICNDSCDCGEVHGYMPRGRYDDGNYVSVEHSDYYQGFAKGYYIVVVASGERKDLNITLTKILPTFKDAYIKNAKVYMGCMH